jgi:thiosulfate/3-mercaptopyruvate sulfurtransferase
MHPLIIQADTLLKMQVAGEPVVVLDCSFDLMNPDNADDMFSTTHIAGAVFANLDRDLSTHDPESAINGGRHPLPHRGDFAQTMGNWGIEPTTQVVVYDRNGQNFCGRAWWMMKWCGHEAVAILDGGMAAWQAAGGAMASGVALKPTPKSAYPLGAPLVTLTDLDAVWRHLDSDQTIVDARAAARYRGDVEPLDPIAGHIPGALNLPFNENFDADGRFKSPDSLKQMWLKVLGDRNHAHVVMHCGSGVSAVPNVISMALAGLPTPALYAGSWSEWSRHPETPKTKEV